MDSFLVFIERKSTFTGAQNTGHREFLGELRESGKLVEAGAFTDQSGGAYVLQASTIDEALEVVSHDPMNISSECIYRVKEWKVSS